MSFTVAGIAENTAEDAIEDGISNIVYAMGNCYFGDKKHTGGKCDTLVQNAFDEALEGAGQTLKFSIMTAVIYRVSSFSIVRIVAGSGWIYAWIKKRRVLKSLTKSSKNLFKSKKGWGRFAVSIFSTGAKIVNGSQDENLAVANMANNNMNNVTHLIGQERQTATIQVTSQKKQIMKTLGLNQDAKGLSDTKKIEAYNYKMKTGSWQNNTVDKNLFKSIVPREYIQDTFTFNNAFVKKLNSFTQYAKTTENEIVNLTSILAKTLASKGAL